MKTSRFFAMRTFVLCLCLLLFRLAHAEQIPVPHALDLDSVATAVVAADLRVSRAAVLDAYQHYVRGIDAAMLTAGKDWRTICEQGHIVSGAYIGSRDAQRLNELEVRSFQAARDLVTELADKLAAAAGPDQSAKAAQVRDALTIFNENAQIYGGSSGYIEVRMPQELSRGLAESALQMRDATFTAHREAVLALLTVNAQARIDALRSFQEALRDNRMAGAKMAEALKVVGRRESEVREEDNARYREAQQGHGDAEAMQAAHKRAAELSVTSKMWEFQLGPSPKSAAWARMLKEQLAAFASVEPVLPPELLMGARSYWLSSLLPRKGGDDELGLPIPKGSWMDDPRGFMQSVLRVSRLSAETRAKLRTISKEWFEADAQIYMNAAHALLKDGADPAVGPDRKELAQRMVARIAQAADLPSLVASPPTFPDEPLLDDLSEDDADVYGAVYKPPPPSEALARAIARDQIRPWKYAPDMVEDLAVLLQATPAQRSVIDVAIADARQRWEETVTPLVNKSLEPEFGSQRSRTFEEVSAWRAKYLEAVSNADGAFKAAYACDDKLFADLAAALSGSIDANTLAIAAASRRSGEGTLFSRRFMGEAIAPNAVDIPRAALTAPLSAEGRRAAIAALAGSVARWNALGKERCRYVRQLYPMRVEGFAAASSQNPDHEYAARAKAFMVGFEQVNDAWEKAELDATAEVEKVLSPSDAAIWHAELRRLRWPRCYYSIAEIRKAAEAALAKLPAESGAVEPTQRALAAGESDAQRSGDAACELMMLFPTRQDKIESGEFRGDQTASVLMHFRCFDYARADLVAERVRMCLGEEVPGLRRQSHALRRLAAMSAAPATSPPALPATAP